MSAGAALLLAACGGTGSRSGTPASSASPSTSATASSKSASIVGLWEQVHTCNQLVRGLRNEGLAPLAPGVVGDFFPGQTAAQLARNTTACRGATPQRHAHFFTAEGAFGSVDQADHQVDDGHYTATSDLIRIGDSTFRFRVVDGRTLDPDAGHHR